MLPARISIRFVKTGITPCSYRTNDGKLFTVVLAQNDRTWVPRPRIDLEEGHEVVPRREDRIDGHC